MVVDVSHNVTNFEIAPDGSRALFGARGDVFTVPAKYGPTRNLTRTPGVHERASKWSPDGKWISYISDATGEDEIYIVPQDGQGAAVQLTRGSDNYKFDRALVARQQEDRLVRPQAAPPVRRRGHQGGDPRRRMPAGIVNQVAWSPDSKWIAFSKPEDEAWGGSSSTRSSRSRRRR